ncbi:hypothetical protein IFM89_003142 [Coptis chinensis]|uniref:Uncharacterized protein n=1 Tax=Coptis chinensis TaxID=261450 RepID=A0A835M196_9MAGN|nr:hypothetical protein IFM89_003142 [Coptis chinensis]
MGCQERRGGRMGGWSDLVWIAYMGGELGLSLGFPHPGSRGRKDQVGRCERLDALSPFNPLSEIAAKGRKIHGPTPYRLHLVGTTRSQGASASRGHGPTIEPSIGGRPERRWFTPMADVVVRVRFYLQLVNLTDTKDGIALKLTARFKRGKAYDGYLGTREAREGRMAFTEMLRGVENKHRSRRFPNRSTFEPAAKSMGGFGPPEGESGPKIRRRRGRWTTVNILYYPCLVEGPEEARLAERWLSVQGRQSLRWRGEEGSLPGPEPSASQKVIARRAKVSSGGRRLALEVQSAKGA